MGAQDMALYLGFISAGLAVALKDLLVNLTAWLFIVIRKPFTVGDRITIGPTSGDVIDIRLFTFTLAEIGNWVDADQSTGRIVHVPNGFLFLKEMFNYTQASILFGTKFQLSSHLRVIGRMLKKCCTKCDASFSD